MTAINNVLAPISFIFTLVGLGFTYWQARRARTSAEAAEQAATSVANKLSKYNAISELTRAKAAAEEIRRYQARKAWDALPESYNALAIVLEEIEAFNQVLLNSEIDDLNIILEFAREKEESTSTAIEESIQLNKGKLNRELGEHTKTLGRILGRLKKELETKHDAG